MLKNFNLKIDKIQRYVFLLTMHIKMVFYIGFAAILRVQFLLVLPSVF
jgi:hypothetical protein